MSEGLCAAGLRTGPLHRRAREITAEECGPGILLRGIVEFSSYCRNTCRYCGLNRRSRDCVRYRLSREQILTAAAEIAAGGARTIVLQSGEDPQLSASWLAGVIAAIKERFDLAVTLSVGEWPRSSYRLWKQAGADRFLLKIETSAPRLYEELHPGMSFRNRLACLADLADLGYQTGTGIIIGLPGQTREVLERDLRFLAQYDPGMISIGPFIPHPGTDLAGSPPGSLQATCDMIARVRCLTRHAHMPATSALGASAFDRRHLALRCGANVIMANFTPPWCAAYYDIYPDRMRTVRKHAVEAADPLAAVLREIRRAGLRPDFSRGDALIHYATKGTTT